MIRFVIGPGDVVVPDIAARLPGRGIWLSARGDVLETAATKGAFARAARRNVVVPPGLCSLVETALRRRVVEHIGFARRAGQAVAGFAKAREMICAGRCGLVIQARDGSAEERFRLVSGSKVEVATSLDAATLAAVFGRDHIVHVAIAEGRLADLLIAEFRRLSGVLERAPGTAVSGMRRAGA